MGKVRFTSMWRRQCSTEHRHCPQHAPSTTMYERKPSQLQYKISICHPRWEDGAGLSLFNVKSEQCCMNPSSYSTVRTVGTWWTANTTSSKYMLQRSCCKTRWEWVVIIHVSNKFKVRYYISSRLFCFLDTVAFQPTRSRGSLVSYCRHHRLR